MADGNRRSGDGTMVMKVLGLALAVLVASGVGAAADQACRDEIGAEKAGAYVEQCLAISPATHPPCNASNPCAMIINEIVRGCRIDADSHGGKSGPDAAFCASYLQASPTPAPPAGK